MVSRAILDWLFLGFPRGSGPRGCVLQFLIRSHRWNDRRLSLSLSLSLLVNASVAAWTPPLAPPTDFKPIAPVVDDGLDDDCAIFWEWREVPAPAPFEPVFCLAKDWGNVDPENAFPPVGVIEPEVCARIITTMFGTEMIRSAIAYYWAQCDEFLRASSGWTRLESVSRLTRKSGRCDSCPEIFVPNGDSINAQDRLVIRFLPLPDAKPIRVSLRAKTRILLTGRLEVENCAAAFAHALVQAKMDFKPGIWSAEIAAEMALENQGTLAATVDETLKNPGHVLQTATAFSVGGDESGGARTIGFERSTQTPPSRYAFALHHERFMNFYAAWCVAPPQSGSVAEFIASVDLEADTHVTQDQASEARANVVAETIAMKFAKDRLYPDEDACAPCTGGQPAEGPSGFPGGGGGQ